ncbi:hypothetical protein HX004_07835 [Myroides sp. 1354]|uniref:hypothetical protein n=1 Tax=unclassified Myroides TaxID=2642485 RepID=UPI0025790307|nr:MULTISPECIES: hypothetical protein [unclassified Myroides]MDM1044971.1 hypothetical protein [Myroides sp. R163-1]MDM1055684.1 hypothetical protein [Myroides sp. 1354]MDM1068981.1 hypothetical protein [Myroides sp. 1372]
MDERLKGMTINERLYTKGLINAFDRAIVQRDVEKIIEILSEVEVEDEHSIQHILQSLNLLSTNFE